VAPNYRCSCGVTYAPSMAGNTAVAIAGLKGFRTLEPREDGLFHCDDSFGWHDESWCWPWMKKEIPSGA